MAKPKVYEVKVTVFLTLRAASGQKAKARARELLGDSRLREEQGEDVLHVGYEHDDISLIEIQEEA